MPILCIWYLCLESDFQWKFSDSGPQDLFSHLFHNERFCQNVYPTLSSLILLLCLWFYPCTALRLVVRNIFSGTTIRYHCFYSEKSGPYLLEMTEDSLKFFATFAHSSGNWVTPFPDMMLETHLICLGWSVDKAVGVSPDRALITTPFSKFLFLISLILSEVSIAFEVATSCKQFWFPTMMFRGALHPKI